MKQVQESSRSRLLYGVTAVSWLLLILSWIGLQAYGMEGAIGQRAVRMAILQLSFLEVVLIAVSMPLHALHRMRSFEHRDPEPACNAIVRALFRAGSVGFVFVGTSIVGLGLSGVLLGGLAFTSVLASQGVLAGFVLVVASCAVLMSHWHANVVDAAGVVYALVLACVAGLILLGPVDSAIGSEGLVQSALVANPFVGVASALEFDLMRSEWLYRISPLARRGFRYPSPYAAAGVYAIATALFFFGAVWKYRSPDDHRYWGG